MSTRPVRSRLVGAAGSLALAVTGVAGLGLAAPAQATPAGDAVVINEVYGGGGNSGAAFTHDFVELYNPTSAPVDLAGLGLEYKSASGGSGGVLALSGTVPAQGHFLVQLASGNGNGQPLPAADLTGTLNLSGANGRVYLKEGTGQYATTTGDLAGAEGLVDMVGFGSAASYETAPAPSLSNATSASRAAGADSDHNATDFAVGAPTPTGTGGGGTDPGTDPEPEPGEEVTIAEVQGEGDTSPLAGRTVTTTGVVTADYNTGGFRGFYIQDPAGEPGGASDGLFVFGSQEVSIGDSVSVTGPVSEYQGTTEISPAAGGVELLDTPLGDVVPQSLPWDALDTEAEKEAHEGELVLPVGPFTVTDNYDANFYGSFGLAAGDTPLVTPTDVADAQDTAAIREVEAENAARRITLDDGASTNFNSSANKGVPLPYLTPDNPVRVGSQATFHAPVVLEYRFDAWTFQPTTPVTGDGSQTVTFSDTRAENVAPAEVGGDARLATFNVLNYFPTTGEEIEAAGGTCTYYTDRAGEPVGVNSCTTADGGDGPRGAADAEDLERQETKIVTAINSLDASVVSLEELENSVKFGKDRDFAIGRLVEALNEQAGAGTWAYVPSPAAEDLPALDAQDVIRTGFIYKPADVEPVGESRVLVDSPAFGNARQPLFQAFKATGAPDAHAFLVSVNHFKSKGSGVDDGTGQGNANPDRIAQAEALVEFADEVAAEVGTDRVFLAGDFNSYSMEDPVQVIEAAGYTNLNHELNGGEATYNFDGMEGSLDHVFASPAALEMVTGVDVWQINAQEQVGFEYSRYNYNATILYDESVFRASDHNPEVVGLSLGMEPVASTVTAPATTARFKQTPVVDATVTADGVEPTGTVEVRHDGRVVGSATLADGTASVPLDGLGRLKRGTYTLELAYTGDEYVAPGSGSVQLRITNPAGR